MNLLVIGAGGHARAIITTAERLRRWREISVIDIDYKKQEEKILGKRIAGGLDRLDSLNNNEHEIAVAIGDALKRKEIIEDERFKKFKIINIVHDKALVDKTVTMGVGNYIGPMAHIGPLVKLGSGNIINTMANIEHEVEIGSYCQMSPCSVICGRTKLKDLVFLGANATILEKLTVVSNVKIGAGAVIVGNIDECNGTYIGIPGRKK
jgi:acetyltransferase EpsM